jgi:PAS domain S-box-containing protein
MVFRKPISSAELSEVLVRQLADQKHALDEAAIVATTDPRGIITYVNDKFCEISRYPREELIGKSHRVVNSGFHRPDFFADLWKSISSGQVWRGEICNRKKTGELYWVYTTIVPMMTPEGRPDEYLAIRYEITELKLAQEKILDQQAKLVASSRLTAIGEMAATITHEINNPLSVILGRVEMMKDMLADGKYQVHDLQRVADTIEATARRIEKIVRGMKTMAYQAGGSSAEEAEPKQEKAVREMIEDATDLCLHRFKNNGLRLEIADFDKNLKVYCHSFQVVQVLVNLLNNAFDALTLKTKSERASSPPWVRIEVIPREKFIELVVSDSGHGIPADVQKKMFDPFFSTKPVQFGTGLGLSISQSLVNKAGGSLVYDSTSPNTRFVCSVPRSPI